MGKYINLYHASLVDCEPRIDVGYDILHANNKNSWLFDGLFAKESIQELDSYIQQGKIPYVCDIQAKKICTKSALVRSDAALIMIARELGSSDLNLADMFSDFIFLPLAQQIYKYDEFVDVIQPKGLVNPKDTYENKIRFIKFEVVRLMGKVAKLQGYDAISIINNGVKDTLVVSEEVEWTKVEG